MSIDARPGLAQSYGRSALLWALMAGATFLLGQGEATVDAREEYFEALVHAPPGFDHPGEARVATRGNTRDIATLRIRVTDATTGETIPARLNVVGPDGNYYHPAQNSLGAYSITEESGSPGQWGNRRGTGPYRYMGHFFYTTGEVMVRVPAGPITIDGRKGFEYAPAVSHVQVERDTVSDIEIRLNRSVDMTTLHYYSGDSHLHFPRRQPGDDETIFDLLEAEDLRYGTLLANNHPASSPYVAKMGELKRYPQLMGLGADSARMQNGRRIISGQEYRTVAYGHLNLYLLDHLAPIPIGANSNHWPVLGLVAQSTVDDGGVAIMAHGGAARSIYADLALGHLHTVEMLQFARYLGIGLEDWYHMLNAGYRVSIVAASDYPPCRALGDNRSYVHADTEPTITEWIESLADGHSFVSTGPLIVLEADGRKPGEIINRTAGDSSPIIVRIRVRSVVAPVTDVQLVVNGRIAEHHRVPDDFQHAWVEIQTTVDASEPLWLAVRAFAHADPAFPNAEAHTNPIYVYRDGHRPFEAASVDTWISRIGGLIEKHDQRDFVEKERLLAYFKSAQAKLREVRLSASSSVGIESPIP